MPTDKTKWMKDFEKRWAQEDIENSRKKLWLSATRTEPFERPTPKISEEIRKLIPLMSEKEREALKDSIRRHGLQSPIDVAPDGTVLDGQMRLEICRELNLTPELRKLPIIDPLDQQRYAIEANFARRHLNTFQKAELWMPLLEVEKKIAERRQKSGTLAPKEAKGKALEKVGQRIGLSKSTLERCLAIIQIGDDGLKDAVREGRISIASAYARAMGGDFARVREDELESLERLPEVKQYLKLVQNAGDHETLVEHSRIIYCPSCRGHELGWLCCAKTIEEARVTAREQLKSFETEHSEIVRRIGALNRGTAAKLHKWAKVAAREEWRSSDSVPSAEDEYAFRDEGMVGANT